MTAEQPEGSRVIRSVAGGGVPSYGPNTKQQLCMKRMFWKYGLGYGFDSAREE
jgi:hypothetical protein